MITQKDIPQHVQALSNQDPYIRWNAAWSLGKIAEKGYAKDIVDNGALPLLLECLKDNDKQVRKWAVYALEKIGLDENAKTVIEKDVLPAIQKPDIEKDIKELQPYIKKDKRNIVLFTALEKLLTDFLRRKDKIHIKEILITDFKGCYSEVIESDEWLKSELKDIINNLDGYIAGGFGLESELEDRIIIWVERLKKKMF